MSTLFSSSASFDDLVFEGRNQAYGAFQLRRLYGAHLRSALLLALSLCLLLLLVPVVLRYFETPAKEIIIVTSRPLNPEFFNTQPDIVKPKAPAAAAPPAVTVKPHSDVATRVVPDPLVKPSPLATLPQNVGLSGPASSDTGNPEGKTRGEIGVKGPVTDTALPAPLVAPVPLVYAEKMPEFAGGQEALRKYLQKHLRFPAAALANQISGRVYVSFVVLADGTISDVTVPKGLGYGTDEAAAKVVREMPAWVPGMQNQHSVPVRFTLPITFQYE